jgi:hypothetical protein
MPFTPRNEPMEQVFGTIKSMVCRSNALPPIAVHTTALLGLLVVVEFFGMPPRRAVGAK